MWCEPQGLGVLNRLFHQLARTTRVGRDHGEFRPIVIPDPLAVILGLAFFIAGHFHPKAENIHQENPREHAPSGPETGDKDPANALAEKVLWPKRFVSYGRRLSTGCVVHDPNIAGQQAGAILHFHAGGATWPLADSGFQRPGTKSLTSLFFMAGRRRRTSVKYSWGLIPRRRQLSMTV